VTRGATSESLLIKNMELNGIYNRNFNDPAIQQAMVDALGNRPTYNEDEDEEPMVAANLKRAYNEDEDEVPIETTKRRRKEKEELAQKTAPKRVIDGYAANEAARLEREKPPAIAEAKLVSIPVVRTFDEVYAQWTNHDVNRDVSRPLKEWSPDDLKKLSRGVLTVCHYLLIHPDI
jgi:hypothetical protein